MKKNYNASFRFYKKFVEFNAEKLISAKYHFHQIYS
jgi:hypothetical protein